MTSLFTQIDHVGIAVPDLDEAIAFYRDTFGIVSVHEEVNEEQGVREAMLAVGDGATRIQLLAPLSSDSTIAKFLDRNGPGVQQVAYTVDDIDKVSDALRERGMRLLYDQPRRGTSDSRVKSDSCSVPAGRLSRLKSAHGTRSSSACPPQYGPIIG